MSAPPIPGRSEAPPRTAGAVLGLASDGRIVAADEAAHGMFGHAPGTLLGMPIAAMLPSARLAGLLAGEDDGVHHLSLEGRRANAVPFPVEATVRLCAPGGATRALCRLREPERSELAGAAQLYFDVAFDAAPIGMALFNTDGEYVRVNPALCALLDRPAEALIGRRDQELTHPEDRQTDLDAAWRILAGEMSTFQCEKRFVRPDGSVVWAIANLTFLRDLDGRPLSWVGQFQDITSRRAAEEALRTERDVSRALLGAMHDGYALAHRGTITDVNDALCRLTGFTRDELVGTRAPFPYFPADDPDEAMAVRARMIRAGGGEAEVTLVRKGGEPFHASVRSARVHGPDGEELGFVTTVRDISERKRHEEDLTQRAMSDGLTGLLNRRAFDERLRAEAARAVAEGRPLSVALLDLDHFKAVNDRHGHPAGDRVLVQTAACLRAVSRFGDHVARVGGEEFAWILPNTDGAAAIRAAERVRCAMAAVDLGDVAAATLSIGVCELAVAGEAGRLYELADVALYRAKAAGRDRCVLHPPL